MTEQLNGTLLAEAQGFAATLERSISDHEADLRGWAENPFLLGGLLFGSYEKSNEVLATLRRRYPMFKGLLLLDAGGEVVAASSPQLQRASAGKGTMLGQSPWFQAAMAGRPAAQAPGQKDPLFGGHVLLLSAPLLDRAGTPIGVLLSAYDWADVAATAAPAVERARARGQPSLRLLIADRQGRLLFDSSGARGGQDARGLAQPGERQGVERRNGQVVAWAASQSPPASAASGWLIGAALDEREAYGLIRGLVSWTVAGSALLVVLAVLLAAWASRRLIEPLRALHQTVSAIWRERDLTHKVPVTTEDEIGELARAFSELVESLRQGILQLRQSAFTIGSATQALQAATDEQRATFSRQAAMLDEASSTAKEIKRTSVLASQRAEATLKASRRANEVGKAGESLLAATVGGLAEIREQVTTISGQIRQLSDRTQQIGSITRTVKDLADQSNMLALNAAIEAVRSGQHGKGFSIVAREIRSLADQSIRATGRVAEILSETSLAIRSATQTTDRGTERMEHELAQVRSSSENLKELSSIVESSGVAVREIAAAVQQQDAGFAQVLVAITDLAMMMEESLQRLSTTEQASKLVSDASEQVAKVAGAYRA